MNRWQHNTALGITVLLACLRQLLWRPRFNCMLHSVRFVVYIVAQGQYFGSLLSISFYQYSILIHLLLMVQNYSN